MSAAPPDASPAGGVLPSSHSLFQQCLFCVAIGWLAARVLSIVRQPKTELAEFIGLAEPARPVILVEGLGNTWVSIYWYYPSSEARSSGKRRPKARKYVVEVGNQVIEAAREQRKVTVDGLEPDTSYKLTVKAIQTPPVHLHHHHHHHHHTGGGIEEGISSILGTSDPGSVVVSSSIYLHTLNSGPVTESIPPVSTLLRSAPLEPIVSESVEDILAIQAETRSVLDQFDASEAEFTVKYRALLQEYNVINEQRKLDDSQRAHIRAESKSCENRKHALDIQLSKLKQRAVRAAKFRADIESMSLELAALEQQHAEQKKAHQLNIDVLETERHSLESRESRLAQNVKDANQRLKAAEAESVSVREFLNKLKDTGNHFASHQLELLETPNATVLGSQDRERIEHELRLDERIEREWVRAQKSLEQRYVDAYLMSSEKDAQKLTLQPLPHDVAPQSATTAGSSVPAAPSGFLAAQDSDPDPDLLSPRPQQQTPPTPGSVKDLSNHNSVLSVNGGGLLPPPPTSPSPSAVPSYASMQSLPSMSLHTSTSIPSFESVPSVQSLHGVPLSSASPLSSGVPQPVSSMPINSLSPYAAVTASQPFGPPYPFGGPAFSYSGRSTPTSVEPDDAMLSPSAAHDLIPSNLFQDSDHGDADAAGEEGDMGLDIPETPRAPARPAQKDSSPWLPWLSPHHRSHKRNSSLFFGASPSDSPGQSVFTTHNDTFDEDDSQDYWNHHAADDPDHETEREDNVNQATSPKSPRKRGGSRFFHKTGSGSKHGNFVRRLSIFSRKDLGDNNEANVTNE